MYHQMRDRMKSNQTGLRPCLAGDRKAIRMDKYLDLILLRGSDEVEVTTEPEIFTSGIQPRGMTKKTAAAYCGCGSLAAFDDWVRRGILPGSIPGTHRWDRKAIDLKLDLASDLQSRTAPASALEEWRAKKNARAS
jgi:hypothetical protein